MATSNTQSMSGYRYNVSLKYGGGSEEVTFKTEEIKSIVIDSNYEKCNMPVIMVLAKLDKKLVQDMLQNINNAYIILKIDGYDNTASYKSAKTAINCKCLYFMQNTMNKNDPIDYANQKDNLGEVYTDAVIGMIPIFMVNNNRHQCAVKSKDIKMQDLAKKIMDHMENVNIEDFTNNEEMPSVIIPPNMSDSVNKTLTYLNNQKVFYNTPYRYFQEFDNTFLISSSGNAVPASNCNGLGNTGDNIVISISEIDDMTTSISGIINNILGGVLNALGLGSLTGAISGALSSFTSGFGKGFGGGGGTTQVAINYANMQAIDLTIENKSKNKIKGMENAGIQDADLSSKSDHVKEAYNSRRLNNDNTGMLENIKFDDDANTMLVTFNKNDLAVGAFTINKSISISNSKRFSEYNGKYLMMRKQELFERGENDFVLTSYITLRKIADGDKENSKTGSGSFFKL